MYLLKEINPKFLFVSFCITSISQTVSDVFIQKYFYSKPNRKIDTNCFVVQRKYSDAQCTVWKLRKFTLTHFRQKFRESNGFT